MTTRPPQAAKPESQPRFTLPDPPEREPEDNDQLRPPDHERQRPPPGQSPTIVAGERYVTLVPGALAVERMVPDLLIDMGEDPEAYRENNGYIISEQGKPPDFVLEIALRSTGRQDARSSTGPV